MYVLSELCHIKFSFYFCKKYIQIKENIMFKKIFFSSLFLSSSILLMAQNFSFKDSKNGFSYNSKGECLLLTDTTDASIVFSCDNPSIYNCKWYKIQTKIENDSTIIDTISISKKNFKVSADSQSVTLKKIDANVGYLVKYGGDSCDIDRQCHAFTWVTQYQPMDSVYWIKDTVICSDLTLYISPTMYYQTEYGNEKKINRTLSVKYNSFLSDENGGTKIEEIKDEFTGSSYITLNKMPYVDTPFEIEDLTSGTSTQKILTDTFYTQAVVAYPYMITNAAQKHEGDTGSDSMIVFSESFKEALNKAANFRSSGALTLNFVCNANEMANHFEWAIANGNSASQADFRSAFVLFEKEINSYVIGDPNLYCIELTVSNIRNDSICNHKSYACLQIAESMLQVPNAFTPNGDGTNDEFRVAYRSIASFYICIYDQWGRRVYESEDITQGWDGNINGKLGTVGTYYYVIKAKGTDDVEYKEKGAVNLIRTK